MTEIAGIEFRKLMRTILVFRVAVVTCIAGAGLVCFSGFGGGGPWISWVVLLAATYGLTVASWRALHLPRPSVVFAGTQLLADVLVATAVVHMGGGFASPFTFLYVLSVLSGAALRLGWGALATASAASAAYAALAVLEIGGVLAFPVPPRLDSMVDSGFGPLMHIVLQICFIHGTGVIAAVMAERVRCRGDELRAKDRALREERLNTDTIIQSMGSGLLTVDNEGCVVHLNRAAEEILGCTRACYAGQPYPALLEERCPDFSLALCEALTRGETPSRMETVVTTSVSEPRPVGISLSLLSSPEGEPGGVVAIFQDLTEAKRMAERVRQADRLAAVGELAGAIAHEIRNPLASIRGSVEMLASELETTGEHRRLMELVLRESLHLKRLTSDFLAYGRLRPKEVSAVNVETLVHEACCFLRQSDVVDEQHEIRRDGSLAGVTADWDAEQMRQVLVNVGLNAIEAMPGGGTLTIRAGIVPWENPQEKGGVWSRGMRAVRLSFEDTGHGIDPEGLRRVFEPFFTTKPKGSGLGLSIVARIVEDHGGLIDMRSHPREGTCFTLTIPGVRNEGVAEDAVACSAEEPVATPA